MQGSFLTQEQPLQARQRYRMIKGPATISRTSQSIQGPSPAWTRGLLIWAVLPSSTQEPLSNSWRSLFRTLQSDRDPSRYRKCRSLKWISKTSLDSTLIKSWARCSTALHLRTATSEGWFMTGTRVTSNNLMAVSLLRVFLMRHSRSWRAGCQTSLFWNH